MHGRSSCQSVSRCVREDDAQVWNEHAGAGIAPTDTWPAAVHDDARTLESGGGPSLYLRGLLPTRIARPQ